MFSILIPTWNNLRYLQLCVDSIRTHSAHCHEILVHVNEGTDGTLEWLRQQGIRHSHSSENIGICMAVNHLAGEAKHDWLVYMNDDMVCCPGWDTALLARIADAPDDRVFLSSLLIEPADTGNDRVIVQNHGTGPENFDLPGLLEHYKDVTHPDVSGRDSQPTVISKRWWSMVGGYSIEFSPGMSSDNDLIMKLWIAGFRRFEIISDSRLYHFACKSTGRIRKNRGSREFVLKWGITQTEFMRDFVAKTAAPSAHGDFDQFPEGTRQGRFKRAVYGLMSNIPLLDLAGWNRTQASYGLARSRFTPVQSAADRDD